jgi:hypothetical protein
MSIPQDVITWVEHNFSNEETELALSLLDTAETDDGSPATPRLLRCAAVGSCGKIDLLTHLIKQLRVDWRDVIVSGEYEINGDNWVQIHDFEQPIEA